MIDQDWLKYVWPKNSWAILLLNELWSVLPTMNFHSNTMCDLHGLFLFLFVCHKGRSFIELVILKCCYYFSICMTIDNCTLSSSLRYYLVHYRCCMVNYYNHWNRINIVRQLMEAKFTTLFALCSGISLTMDQVCSSHDFSHPREGEKKAENFP